MTFQFRAQDIPASEMASSHLELPTATPLSGVIRTRSCGLYATNDGKIKTGTWECEPGTSRWEFLNRGEFIHVISGRMIVHEDGQHPLELSEGSTAVFPIGWQGDWIVLETLRKVFVIYTP